MQQFQQVYRQLNAQQQQAVDSIDGPVMVLAGPGTGKTQVLAARIARILDQTDTLPHAILALTFTESAAQNMRRRLVKMIGKAGYYVQINTFHSFCSQVIQDHPEYFPIDKQSEPLTDLQRYGLFESIMLELDLDILKPLNRQLFYLFDVMKAISDLKREGISPEGFKNVVSQEEAEVAQPSEDRTKSQQHTLEKNLSKHKELLEIYQEYEKRIRSLLTYDYDDMIMLVLEAFTKEDTLLLEYQENIHYFLVDEYQDTNSAQNKIVDTLGSFWQEQPNIFVVGDPNQAIYRFQGASMENALGFVDRYPQAKIIQLEQGYRCSNIIYDRAFEVISNNELQTVQPTKEELFSSLQKSLKNQNSTSEKPIKLYQAPSQTLEVLFIAESIKDLLAENVSADQIAVLYRHNKDVVEIQEALEKWGIQYEIDGGNNILQVEIIHQFLQFLKTISQVSSNAEDGELYQVLQYDWLEIESLLVFKIARAASKARTSIVALIESGFEHFSKYDQGPEITPIEFAVLTGFVEKMKQWYRADANSNFPAWFEQVVNQSGFLEWITQQPNKIELLHYLQSLFRQVKALGTKPAFKLTDFLSALETMQEHRVQLLAEDLNVTQNAVRLSTLHKAKGQEWEYVFLMHCVDKKWGNTKKRELIPLPDGILSQTDVTKKERNEDDRRLFYVGLTRAKKQVIITYPETVISESKSTPVSPSMFIEEIRTSASKSQILAVQAPEIAQNADMLLTRLLQPAPVRDYHQRERAYLQSLVDNFSLSVSSLNSYLRDPQEFLRQSLLRVPQATSEPLAFGTAVHTALEAMYKPLLKDEALLTLDKVLEVFQVSLRKELIDSNTLEKRLKHGQKLLTDFYQQVDQEQVPPIYIERFFGSGFSRTHLDDIALRGRIDRVDWYDKKTKQVKVIDYKTGKPKSVNEIEGKVKSMDLSARERQLPESIRGPYKRQLLFYKLLTELDPTFVPTVTHGAFVFLEPSSSGKLVIREFELRQEDVEDLKLLIKQVMAEIRQLQFLTQT